MRGRESFGIHVDGKPKNAAGSVVACAMEGTRPMLMEIQALICGVISECHEQ